MDGRRETSVPPTDAKSQMEQRPGSRHKSAKYSEALGKSDWEHQHHWAREGGSRSGTETSGLGVRL